MWSDHTYFSVSLLMESHIAISKVNKYATSESGDTLVIGLVGPSASGKSTLRDALIERGYLVRHIAQEHSCVSDMWRRVVNPNFLIFLDVSYPLTLKRRKTSWTTKDYEVEQRRLCHARQHADYYLDTDRLTTAEVVEHVIRFLAEIFAGVPSR